MSNIHSFAADYGAARDKLLAAARVAARRWSVLVELPRCTPGAP